MSKWFLSAMLFCAFATAQAPMPLPAPSVQTDTSAMPPAPQARMYAVYAHGAVPEQPHTDDKLKPIAALLKRLPFTSFEEISILDKEMPWGETTAFPINALYSMDVTPKGLSEEGVIELHAKIDMLQDNGAYKAALETDGAAAPQQALIFRGMPLQNGELVVVLLVGMPQDENQQGNPQEDDTEQQEQQEQEQEQQQQQQEQQEPQEEGESDSDETPESAEADAAQEEGETPEGLDNLDALLESLEDVDRREQVEERNRRNRIDFKGDWW